MTHPLLKRWSNWSGTASDAADELNRFLGEKDTIRQRKFQYYAERGAVSPSGKGRPYGARHLLEALATRQLANDGWKIEKIAEVLPTYNDEALAELVQPTNQTVAPNPAVALVRSLQAKQRSSDSPLRSMSLAARSMHGPADTLLPQALRAFPTFEEQSIAAASAFAADEPAPALAFAAVTPEPRLSWRADGIELTVDSTVAASRTAEDIRAIAITLADRAIAHLYPQQPNERK